MPLGSNVIEFTIKGQDKFSGPMGKVGKALGTGIRTTAKFAAGLAAAGAAAATFANKVAQGEDRAAKFARRVGVAVDELTTYQHVAEVAGIQQQTFNMAIQRMTRRVGEAAKGTGEAQDAIRDLGLDARRFAELPLGEQLQTLADKFENVDGRAQKLRIAFKLFDSEGASMIQMLKNGSAEMQEMAADAQKLGATIDRQAAANAEEFTTQTTRLTAAIGGASRAIADEWIPVLAGLAKHAADTIGGMSEQLSNWARQGLRAFLAIGVAANKVFTQLFDGLKELAGFEGWVNLAKGASRAFGAIFKAFGELLPTMGKIAALNFKLLWQAYLELGKWAFQTVFNVFIAGFPTLVKAIGQMFKVMFQGIVEIGKWAWQKIKGVFTGEEGPTLGELLFQKLPEATAQAREQLATTFQSVVTNAPDLGKVLFEKIPAHTARTRQRLFETWGELTTQLKEKGQQFAQAFAAHFGISADTINAEVDRIIQRFTLLGQKAQAESAKTTQATASYMKEIRKLHSQQQQEYHSLARQMAKITMDTVDQVATGLAQTFTAVLVQGKSIMETLQSFAKQLIADLVTAIAKAVILRTILGSIGGGGGLLGGIGGIFHSGIRYVPQEGSYLLDKGERVLSKQQNEDLTRALNNGGLGGGGGGGGTNIENLQIHVMENATHSDALLSMSSEEIREVVARKFIPALDQLDKSGVRPVALERQGG